MEKTEEMKGEIWQSLSENLLPFILTKLPTRNFVRMRSVCKQWAVWLPSMNRKSHGFLLHWRKFGSPEMVTWVIEESGDFYKVPYDKVTINCNHLELASHDMYCCSNRENRGRFRFSICKASASASWRHIPDPLHITHTNLCHFFAIACNSSNSHCIVLLGQCRMNHMMIEVYDSESNAWTQIQTIVPNTIRPFGRAIYFKGTFYWLNSFSYCEEVVGFDVENKCWITIPCPTPFASCTSRDLIGSEERLVLFDKIFIEQYNSMWKWEDNKWCRLNVNLPETIHQVTVNSSGWTLVVGDKIYLYDRDGRIANTIELIDVDDQLSNVNYMPVFVLPFVGNMACWPF